MGRGDHAAQDDEEVLVGVSVVARDAGRVPPAWRGRASPRVSRAAPAPEPVAVRRDEHHLRALVLPLEKEAQRDEEPRTPSATPFPRGSRTPTSVMRTPLRRSTVTARPAITIRSPRPREPAEFVQEQPSHVGPIPSSGSSVPNAALNRWIGVRPSTRNEPSGRSTISFSSRSCSSWMSPNSSSRTSSIVTIPTCSPNSSTTTAIWTFLRWNSRSSSGVSNGLARTARAAWPCPVGDTPLIRHRPERSLKCWIPTRGAAPS